MKIFQVGGSLRDELLGLPVSDRDWVVVGASPQQMVDAGFRPVGRDFPVFLHPRTHEEYALARTERKTAPGYKGFAFHSAPDVTLEEDLARRDFTVNAMARDADDSTAPIVDPYGGRADLADRVLRHVSPAFAEDPVRILRGARFVARFGFSVAPETMTLMRRMTEAGEVDALVPERVWQEMSRGLMEADPQAMFGVLMQCGALIRIAPELARYLPGSEAMRSLAAAARGGMALAERFASLCARLSPTEVTQMSERLRVPTDCRDLAVLAATHRESLLDAAHLDARQLAELVRVCDGLRQQARFRSLVTAAQAVAAGSNAAPDYAGARVRLLAALAAFCGVDAGRIAAEVSTPAQIQAALRTARERAVAEALAAAGLT
jgi:tRNA nucleotidyltransferase (CCA-adding enzyme)